MQNAAVQLRRLSENEHDALAAMWLRSWRSTGLEFAQSTTEELLRERIDIEIKDGWDVTVAVLEARLVGFVAIKARSGLLDQLFVAADMKGRGIGRALLAEAKRRMPDGFSLHTAADNTAACRFYERSGLVRTGTKLHPKLGHNLFVFRWRPRKDA